MMNYDKNLNFISVPVCLSTVYAYMSRLLYLLAKKNDSIESFYVFTLGIGEFEETSRYPTKKYLASDRQSETSW